MVRLFLGCNLDTSGGGACLADRCSRVAFGSGGALRGVSAGLLCSCEDKSNPDDLSQYLLPLAYDPLCQYVSLAACLSLPLPCLEFVSR